MTATIAESACIVTKQQQGTSPQGSTNPLGLKVVCIETPATADDGDVVTINYVDAGLTTIWHVDHFTHSTTDSIIITEVGTTLLSGTVTGQIGITLGGSTDNKKRVILLWGE